jgi:hypothetical protein
MVWKVLSNGMVDSPVVLEALQLLLLGVGVRAEGVGCLHPTWMAKTSWTFC